MEQRHGTFVYLCLKPVRPRVAPSRRAAENGRKFRSGWAITHKEHVQELIVESGLWTFYAGETQAVRPHPTDEILVASRMIAALQKVFLDKKVDYGSFTYYRVQGTGGWLVNKDKEHRPFLLEPSQVEHGSFCFRANVNMVVRSNCSVAEQTKTCMRVFEGQLVSIDAIVNAFDGPENGPYLRLSDGSGFLFQRKHGVEVMSAVEVQTGTWELKILNFPVGLKMRRHPMDSHDMTYKHKVLPSNSMVQATAKIAHGSLSYYRVDSSWITDRRGENILVEVLNDDHDPQVYKPAVPWTPDFVRGVASTVDRVKEVDFSGNNVLTYLTNEGVVIVVYCNTNTVGHQATDKYTWHRGCTAKDLWLYLQKDAVELMKSNSQDNDSDKKDAKEKTEETKKEEDSEEVKTRKELVEIEDEIDCLQKKRAPLLQRILRYDTTRLVAIDKCRALMQEKKRQQSKVERLSKKESEEVPPAISSTDSSSSQSTDPVMQIRSHNTDDVEPIMSLGSEDVLSTDLDPILSAGTDFVSHEEETPRRRKQFFGRKGKVTRGFEVLGSIETGSEFTGSFQGDSLTFGTFESGTTFEAEERYDSGLSDSDGSEASDE